MSASSAKMASKAFLPPQWTDDQYMSGLMSRLKDREVNPSDYDRKVKFWRERVQEWCGANRNAILCLKTLRDAFQRGNTMPAALDKIVEIMQSEGELQPVSEWRAAHSGSWAGWSLSVLSSTTSWLLGRAPAQPVQWLHIPTVKEQAESVLARFHDELEADADVTNDIVAYNDLYQRCSDIVCSMENFDIILQELTARGDVSVGETKSGDKIVKFRAQRSSAPAQFTESDVSVHELRRTLAVLEKKITELEPTIQKLDNEIRLTIRGGDKKKAMVLMRKKKAAEKDIQEKDGQYQRLLSMMHQIGASKHNKEVLDAYRVGADAFKSTLARHGLSPDKVDETMEEIASANDEYRDIEEALSKPMIGSPSATNDAELEDELADLLAAEGKGKAVEAAAAASLRLPDVPSSSPRRGYGISGRESQADISLKELERRMHALREQ